MVKLDDREKRMLERMFYMIDIEKHSEGNWAAYLTVKRSGNQYAYNALFNHKPSVTEVLNCWRQDKRNWRRATR